MTSTSPAPSTVIGGLATFVYGVSGTEAHGWWSVRTVATLARRGGPAGGVPEARAARAAKPLFPPHIWKLNALVSGTAVMLGVTGILVGAVFLTSIFLQTVLGYSALEAGLAFLPFALAITVGTVVARHLLEPRLPEGHRHRRTAHRRSPHPLLLSTASSGAVRRRHASRVGGDRAGRGHGVRARLGDLHGRNPLLARRRGLGVPDDRSRDRRRTRRRRPVRGREHAPAG